MTNQEIEMMKEKHLKEDIELFTRNQYKNILESIENNSFSEEYLKMIITTAVMRAKNIIELKVVRE
jgi:hypothetical protein